MDPLTAGVAALAGFALYKVATKPTVSIPTPPPVNPSNTGGGGAGNTVDPLANKQGIVDPTQQNNIDNQFGQAGLKDAGSLIKGNYVGAVFDYVKIASGQSLAIREGANSYLGKTSVTDNIIQPGALAVGGAAAALLVLAGAGAVYAIPIAAFAFAIIDAAQIIEEKQRLAQYDTLKAKQAAFIDARHYSEAMDIAKQANDAGFNGWGFNITYSIGQNLVGTGVLASNTIDLIGYDSNGKPLTIMDPSGHSFSPDDLLSAAYTPLIQWYNDFRTNNNNARPTRAQLNAAGTNIFAFADWVGFHFPWTICLRDPNGNDSKAGTPITGSGVNSSQYSDSNGNWIGQNITTALKDAYNFPVAEDVSVAQGGTNTQTTQQQHDALGSGAGAQQGSNEDVGGGGGKTNANLSGQNKLGGGY